VLLAGGSINSPQLLQLSGVGPGALLQEHGIPVVHDLPGVGENLQDHLGGRITYRAAHANTYNEISHSLVRQAVAGMQYVFGAGGPLDFRWSDIGLWGPWSMRFLAACDAQAFARGQAALTALLADAMGAWQRIAALGDAPGMVIPHGHVTAWMTPEGSAHGRAVVENSTWGTATWRDMSAEELPADSKTWRKAGL